MFILSKDLSKSKVFEEMSVEIDSESKNLLESQSKKIKSCSNYFFDQNGTVAGFDSLATDPSELPEDLNGIYSAFDSIGQSDFKEKIDFAVKLGIATYQSRNGGDLPHASVIATALDAGHKVASGRDTIKGFDDITNGQFEQASIVPAMTVVTVASVIANALPIIALLPNPTSSIRIPLVSARYTTDSNFGAMKAGDYLDSEKAALPYAEGRFRFALKNGGSGAVYTIAAHTAYLSFKDKTPDTTAPKLPFLAGNISIRINGKEVAHTRGDRSLSVEKGTISANVGRLKVKIQNVEYKVVDSAISIDNSTISVTLNSMLPPEAKLEVFLIANFDAKDANKAYKIKPVGVSIEPEYNEIQAAPFVNLVTLSYNTQNQLANELGIGFVGAALGTLQGKLFLEQNIRLLTEGKERAIMNGRVEVFDYTRGATGNLSSAINTTGELVAEVFKYIEYCKLKIRQATGGSTAKFELYVGDKGAIFFNCLAVDKFTKTGQTASYGEIVRIGTLSDGTDVYHSPTPQGLIAESTSYIELMLAGRGTEPVRNPMVGSIVMPPTIRDVKPDTREVQFGLHGTIAAELNPLERYADQFAVIHMLNIPEIGLNQ